MHNAPSLRAIAAGVVVMAVVVSGPLNAQGSARPTPAWYERLELSGDFRPQFDLIAQGQGAGKEAQDLRTRPRFRLRAGLTSRVSDRLTVGVRLASNEGGNPTSNNVALGRGMAPKTVVLDLAYLDWAPAHGVRVTAGKFNNPLYRSTAGARSQLVWDDDLSPEGLAQSLTPIDRKTGTVRRLTLHLQQWSLQEFAAETDSWMLGGQAVLDLVPRTGAALTLAGGYYGFANGDRLVQAANSNPLLIVTNGVILKDGTAVAGGTLLQANAANPFARYASDFGLVHGALALAQERALGRVGLHLAGETVVNVRADRERLGIQLAAGASELLPRTALTLSWIHLERDATLSLYSYSDLGRGGTNQEGWVATVQYRPTRAVTLTVKEHYLRPILPVTPNTPIHRLQVETNVAF